MPPASPDGRRRPSGVTGGGIDASLRRVAEVEEMVARTHERAAELYETWSGRQGAPGSADLEHRARRHREIAAAARSVERLAERTLKGFEVRVDVGPQRSGKARHLAVLAAWERLRALVDRRITDTVVASRREGATWTEVASALGVTRQTAHERFRHRENDTGGDRPAR